MSKKNRDFWSKQNAAPKPTAAEISTETSLGARSAATGVTTRSEISSISPAQLAANRANSQLSTGPRTESGKSASSKNAVKSALTGRTVLLPTDDRDEYAAFLAQFQKDLEPVGQLECELVQIIVDCHWRLRRIQELEYALYAHGEEQFAEAFADCPEQDRRSKIVLQTHLTYEKQLRNLHIQESRIDRKRAKALAELQTLQSERMAPKQSAEEAEMSDAAPFASEAEFFAALDAGYIPPSLARNGFVFSNSHALSSPEADSGITTR